MKTETRLLEYFRPERYVEEAGVHLETRQIAVYGLEMKQKGFTNELNKKGQGKKNNLNVFNLNS